MNESHKYSTEWIDFVTYPGHPTYADCMEKRIDTSKAFRANKNGELPDEYSHKCIEGLIIEKSRVELDDDKFQAVFFDQFGNVIVWTKKGIWNITQQGNARCIERFLFVHFDHSEFG